MKSYLRYLIVLLSTIVLASPGLGVLTYYGGFASSGAAGDANANGGAYYDIYDTPNYWSAQYGVDAHADTYGIGNAASYTSHSLDTGLIPVSVGGTGYNVELAYGGVAGATVKAIVSQNTNDGGSTFADANIYSYVSISNDGAGTEDMYGSAGIYTGADVYDTNGEASSSASGIAGYVAQKCPTCNKGAEQIWGAVSGTSTSYAIADGVCVDCGADYIDNAGSANGYSAIYTSSSTGEMNWVPHEQYGYAYSDMYSNSNIGVNEGDHVLGETKTSGFAKSGAWDPSTSSYLVKQNGVNENAFSSISGDISTFGEGFIKDDSAYSNADLWSSADSWYDITGYRYLYSNGYFDTYASANRDGAYDKSNPQRVTSTAYITDAAYDSVARQVAIKTESSADKVNVASGAHALNVGGWYSYVYPTANYAWYDNGYMEAYTDIYNEQTGPQFILSANMLDDSGSYIRLENVDNLVSVGYTPAVGVNIDDIDFINWIEGSSLVNNMYPLSQDWTTTYTKVPGASYYDDYIKQFNNGNIMYRESNAEIIADIWT